MLDIAYDIITENINNASRKSMCNIDRAIKLNLFMK